jgi:hypothetical protein
MASAAKRLYSVDHSLSSLPLLKNYQKWCVDPYSDGDGDNSDDERDADGVLSVTCDLPNISILRVLFFLDRMAALVLRYCAGLFLGLGPVIVNATTIPPSPTTCSPSTISVRSEYRLVLLETFPSLAFA